MEKNIYTIGQQKQIAETLGRLFDRDALHSFFDEEFQDWNPELFVKDQIWKIMVQLTSQGETLPDVESDFYKVNGLHVDTLATVHEVVGRFSRMDILQVTWEHLKAADALEKQKAEAKPQTV